MKAIKSIEFICNYKLKSLGIVKCLKDIDYRFVKYLLFFIIISNYFIANAQSNENDFKKIRIEIDGEEVFDVNAITQDHQGYMWMATNLGLIRYNGLEGKKYYNKVIDSTSFESYDIRSLFVDYLGDVWIGAAYGLSKYSPDCDCIQQYTSVNEDISPTDIWSVTEDKNNNVWIGTHGGGLFRYERESDNFTRYLHKPSDSINVVNDNINHLLVDQNNNLWIGTNSYDSKKGSGLILYNISTGNVKQFLHDPTNPNSLLDNRISALYEDQQGQILIGTYKCGFHIYDPKSESLIRIGIDADNPGQLHAPYTEVNVYGNDPFVRLIHQDQNGGHWISTTGRGINYFDATTKTRRNYSFNLINPQLLWSLFEDKQGNLWIGGVWGGGLFKTDPFERKYNLNPNFRNASYVYESPLSPGILWVINRQEGLGKMNLASNNITKYVHNKDNSKSIGHNWVRSAYQEKKGILWVGLGNGGVEGLGTGNGGVDRMDIETGTFTHFKLIRNDDDRDDFSYTVYSIVEDREGILWLGTGTGGLFRSGRDKKEFKHFGILKTGNNSRKVIINRVFIDSNGDLWASDFNNQGTLYLFSHQEGQFNPFLKGFKATNILIDEQGWFLITTWDKGMLHLNPADGNFIQYTKKDGLPSNIMVDIAMVDKDFYWIGTSMGPAKFDAETGKISTVGLPKGRYNLGILKTIDGQIFLASSDGLVSFYPDQVIGNPYPPQINISDMLISDRNYLTGKSNSDEINLPYNQNDIAFKYIGLHFSNSEKNSYRYRLNPINDDWINAGYERTARYFNLPPGSYNFEVKAANSDGIWSDKTAFVQFSIKPSWWTTWWAYAIYIGLVAFLTQRIYRFQLSRKIAASESKRLKEVNQLKNTLFTNITHEFRTPLTVIKGMTGTIKSNLENKQLDDLETSLEMIDRNSDGLLNLVNEMLDLAKIESGNMKLQLVQADIIPFLKYLSESFNSLAEENQISLTIYSEIDTLIMDFDSNKLTSIISNLLSNAVKFTPEFGKIIVHINQIKQKENTCLFIKIKDSGIGISPKELPNIFNRFYQTDSSTIRKIGGTGIGLALTKELVELMKGTIEVKSTLDKGSEFRIMIPVTRMAPASKNVQIGKVPHTSVSNILSIPTGQILETNPELPLVLIIEDNMDVAHYLKTCLLNKYETVHAVNGIVGIEMALEKIPDIIISDVMMPGKDGFEVCATLKSDERTDHIPIIILTAKVTTEDRLTGLSHGADAYLAKPFNKEELFTRLDQLVLVRKKLIGKIQKEGFNTLLEKRTNNPKLQFLQKVVKLIHEDIGNAAFGSGDLVKKLLISDSQIYRKIKAITGKSTAVFIRSIRLQYAKELLLITDKNVSEVAYEVGFNDPSWFSRAFKEEFGVTPSSTSK